MHSLRDSVVSAATRPSLEYQHAFDLCATEVQRYGGPAVLRASSAFYARELMKRIKALRPAQVVSEGTDEKLAEILSGLGPEVEVAQAWSVTIPRPRPGFDIWAETAGVGGLGMPGGLSANAAVWAEPEMQAGDHALRSFDGYLASRGRLCVLTSGWLRGGLPEWKGESEMPARGPVGLRRTLHWLRQAGYTVEAMFGFHGPQSLAWGAASRLPKALGRADLVDRCHAAMRRTFVVQGWQAHVAPVAVVLARKRSR